MSFSDIFPNEIKKDHVKGNVTIEIVASFAPHRVHTELVVDPQISM